MSSLLTVRSTSNGILREARLYRCQPFVVARSDRIRLTRGLRRRPARVDRPQLQSIRTKVTSEGADHEDPTPKQHNRWRLPVALIAVIGTSVFAYLRFADQDDPQYEYRPLENPNEIRVLVLEPGREDESVRCYLKHVTLSSKPHYEAISYVWGDPNVTEKIFCSGGTISITPNLHKALQQLRDEKSERVLWADAVCINQADLQEKNVQVPLMGAIYSQADKVLIWLGPRHPKLEEALKVLRKLDSFFKRNIRDYSSDPSTYFKRRARLNSLPPIPRKYMKELEELDCDKLAWLLNLPWFSRIWTTQEYIRAQNADFVCGDIVIPFNKILVPVSEFYTQVIASPIGKMINLSSRFPLDEVWAIKELGMRRFSPIPSHASLFNLVRVNNIRNCTNPRDKIYGLLGLASDVSADDRDVSPRYDESVEQVFRRFALWCIKQTNSLDIFSSVRDYKVFSTLSLPSWIPDWTDVGGKRDITPPNPNHRASGGARPQYTISETDENTISVKGFVIDKVDLLAVSYYQLTLLECFMNYARSLEAGVTQKEKEKMLEFWKYSEKIAPQYLDGLVPALQLARRHIKPTTPFHMMKEVTFIESCKEVAARGTGIMSRERHEEFWRTLLCNKLVEGEPAPRWAKWMVDEHLHFVDSLRNGKRIVSEDDNPGQQVSLIMRWGTNVPHAGPLPQQLSEKEEHRWRIMVTYWAESRRKRFCCTVEHRLGWVPDPAKPGDLICILYGGRTPYVLRPSVNGRYKLIGPAYVHGLMYGEAMKMKDVVEEDFAIH
ncbi:hypothetical protein M501DRAFT_1004951 [Patellaria atrata CBS 101060]|uniref:Heterokaryon incompatibility domain-containing protein n=1 Tax=Patellaria atrata CBS 101060 TaxID=1346257 RepID=A0A9P4VS22_9PEZI|nr:hypothetical protein M501DRAFT_1004951 [Patellaria atrata CBS 101060]